MFDDKTVDDARKLKKQFDKARRDTPKLNSYSQRVDAAKRYAAADRSDPFALNRAMTHLENGIAGFTKDGRDAFYDAEEYQETRTLVKIVDGYHQQEDYQVPAYKNRVRP